MSYLLTHFLLLGVVVAIAATASRLRLRAEIMHLAWFVVFVKLVIPPVIEIPVLPAKALVTVEVEPVLGTEAASLGEDGRSEGRRQPREGTPTRERVSSPDSTPRAPKAASHDPGLDRWRRGQAWLFGIWIVGALIHAFRVTVSAIRFRRRLSSSGEAPGELQRRVEFLSKRFGLRRIPELRILDGEFAALLWPGFPSTIVLSRTAVEELSPGDLDAMLTHELAHFARRDHWTRILEAVGSCLHWWLPGVRRMRRELRRTEELCCDAIALEVSGQRRSEYAELLIQSAAMCAPRQESALTLLALPMARHDDLKRRIETVMTPTTRRPWTPRLRWALLLPILVLIPWVPTRMGQTADAELDRDAWHRVYSEARLLESVLARCGDGDLEGAAQELDAYTRPDRLSEETQLARRALGEGDLDMAYSLFWKVLVRAREATEQGFRAGLPRGRFEMLVALASSLWEDGLDSLENASIHGALGAVFLELDQPGPAGVEYLKALHLEPGNRTWGLGLLHVLLESGRGEDALEFGRLALGRELHPNEVVPWADSRWPNHHSDQNLETIEQLTTTSRVRLGVTWDSEAFDYDPWNFVLLRLRRLRGVDVDSAKFLSDGFVWRHGSDDASLWERHRRDQIERERARWEERIRLRAALLRHQDDPDEWEPFFSSATEPGPSFPDPWADARDWVPTAEYPSRSRPFSMDSLTRERIPLDVAHLDRSRRPLGATPITVPGDLADRLPAAVEVELEVGITGEVLAARALDSTDEEFEALALETVRSWRLEPGTLNGEPVVYRTRSIVRFPSSESND